MTSTKQEDEGKLLGALALALLDDPKANLQELARAIGISKATLYRFCPTRDQLIDRLIGHAADTLSRAMRAAELERHAPLEALRRLTAHCQDHQTLLLFLMYYAAQRIVSASGRAKRPREDIPSSLRMNRNAVFLFLAGIIGCFIGGVPAMIGATVCGTLGAGFLMAGFASMHLRTRGKDWRLPALVLAYLSTVMLLPLIIPLIIGLSDTRRTVALTPAAKAKTDTPDNTD